MNLHNNSQRPTTCTPPFWTIAAKKLGAALGRRTQGPSINPSLPVWGANSAVTAWRPLLPLLGFALLFHLVAAWVLLSAGLPVRYLPHGEFRLAGALLLVCLVMAPSGLLGVRIANDMILQLRGGKPPRLKNRTADIPRLVRDLLILALVYLVVVVAYVNLKPAIPRLNPATYDAPLESFERALFGGILPTEWLRGRNPAWGLAVWDAIYGLFTLFMFASVSIAIHFEGLRGGARLVLAFSIGLLVDVLATLWFPTRGPLFVHPEWFGSLAELPSGRLAGFLQFTVEQYARSPGCVYACAGISAMPSYHVYAWVCGLLYWRHLPRQVFLAALLLTGLNWMSTVVLGWHYVLDGLAGIVLALLISWALAKFAPGCCAARRSSPR